MLAETDLERIIAAAVRLAPGLLVVDSVQTVTRGWARRPGRLGRPGPGVGRPAGGLRTSTARRSSSSATSPRTAAWPDPGRWSTSSMSCSRSRATATGACVCCAAPRTASARPRRSASSRCPARACATSPTRPAPSSAPTGAEAPGVAVAAILEGSRPLLVEVQALVAPAGIGVPRRALAGVPADRLALLVAVLARRCGLDIARQRPLRQPGRWRERQRARARPAARPRARLDRPRSAARAGHGRLRRGLAAGRAAPGPGPRAAAARGRPAGVPAGDRARRRGCHERSAGHRWTRPATALRIVAVAIAAAKPWRASIGAGPVPSG